MKSPERVDTPEQFAITLGRGFQITFPNGWTVSVQFGYGNYCEHHSTTLRSKAEASYGIWKSRDAEIAAWDKNGVWYNFGGDDVKGYCSVTEAFKFMQKIARKKGQ